MVSVPEVPAGMAVCRLPFGSRVSGFGWWKGSVEWWITIIKSGGTARVKSTGGKPGGAGMALAKLGRENMVRVILLEGRRRRRVGIEDARHEFLVAEPKLAFNGLKV